MLTKLKEVFFKDKYVIHLTVNAIVIAIGVFALIYALAWLILQVVIAFI